MKNAGMAGAVALVGIGLITIGLGNFANTPQAIAAAPAVVVEAGPEEPSIVWFGADIEYTQQVTYTRLWSDGRIEMRNIMFNELANRSSCDGLIIQTMPCPALDIDSLEMDTGWVEVPPPPGGNGFACRADTNGDRRVDGIDLATVLAQWGNGVSCDPQPSYPCFDLGNLGLSQPGM
jgi:hypothetical protein